MDVSGRKPTTKAGEYFRSSIFNWPTILAAMLSAGVEVPKAWEYNDGEGAETQAACDTIADALDQKFTDIISATVFLDEDNIGNRLLRTLGSAEVKQVAMDPDRLRRWITFLRGCGGFTIS